MPVSAITRRPDGTIQARDESGWFPLRDGDSVDMGDGQVLQLLGPSEIGGGSIKAGAVALVIGFAALAVAGCFGIGKAAGL